MYISSTVLYSTGQGELFEQFSLLQYFKTCVRVLRGITRTVYTVYNPVYPVDTVQYSIAGTG